MAATYDAIVIGGGVVGLATALGLVENGGPRRLLVLEREPELGRHQTGHNSGVIHAGVYYQPGSLKARLCRQGLTRTKQFCRERGLPWDECGKLVVAADEAELERMTALAARATSNGVTIERLSGAELQKEEPGIVGAGALFVPESGITDYRRIALELARIIESAGGTIRLGSAVSAITEGATGVRVRTESESFEAPVVV